MNDEDKIEKEQSVEELVQALEEEKEKAQSFMLNWQRNQADFVNYKRRAEQEKREVSLYVKSGVILKLIPVLDDLERALQAIPPRHDKQPWIKGVRLIEQKFQAVLKEQGVTRFQVLGETFDPQLHEAAMSHSGEEGKVVKELSKGYKMGDKIIRPAQVAVGNGEVVVEEESNP